MRILFDVRNKSNSTSFAYLKLALLWSLGCELSQINNWRRRKSKQQSVIVSPRWSNQIRIVFLSRGRNILPTIKAIKLMNRLFTVYWRTVCLINEKHWNFAIMICTVCTCIGNSLIRATRKYSTITSRLIYRSE